MLKVVLFTWADEEGSGPAPGAEKESKNLTLSEDNISFRKKCLSILFMKGKYFYHNLEKNTKNFR